MIRAIFKLAVMFLILHALWQVAPPFWRYRAFKEAVQEVALAGRNKTPFEIEHEVLALAAEHRVPAEASGVEVTREGEHTYIDVTYVEHASPVPGWRVARPVEIHADGWHLKPPVDR